MAIQKTVFISYRRTNMYMARAVYQDLRAHGYDAFLDMERLDSGDFSQGLIGQIAARAHFVLILTPSALERCTSPDDWVRKEIEYAIEQRRNIVPMLFEGVKFEQIRHFLASDQLKLLESYNGLPVPDEYFEEAMERLRGNRYLDRDTDSVLHPIAEQAAKAAKAAQAKADAAPTPTAAQLEAEQLFESGFNKLRLRNDYIGAIDDFTGAILLNNNFADAFHWRGRTKWRSGDKNGALHDLKMAVKLQPYDRQINIIRSAIADLEGNKDVALAESVTGVNQNPDYDEAFFRRAHARNASGDIEGAIADYGEVIRLNPQYALAYNNRGMVRKSKGDLDGAIADYEDAIRLFPEYAAAYNNRGMARKSKGDLDGAIADYKKALNINPNHRKAAKNLEIAERLRG